MRLILAIFLSVSVLGTNTQSFAGQDDLKACLKDSDCFLADSCMGCNHCYSVDPLSKEGWLDCKAVCDVDPTLQCDCVSGTCKESYREKSELLNLLKGEFETTRCQAAEALGEIKNDPEVAEALTKLLNDPSEWVKSCAQSALNRLK